MSQNSGLTIRQFERHEASLPAELLIADDLHRQVTFSASSGLLDNHTVDGVSVDFSPGGAGLNLRRFVPRATTGTLRILDPTSHGTNDDGSLRRAVLFEHEVKVKRVMLLDHQPTYFIGVSFMNHTEASERNFATLLEHIERCENQANSGAEGVARA